MALFPVSSNFEEDFVLQLVPVDTENTMDEVAAACAVHSVNRRVRPRNGVLRVRRHTTGEVFPRDMQLKDAGLMPSETIDIIYEDV